MSTLSISNPILEQNKKAFLTNHSFESIDNTSRASRRKLEASLENNLKKIVSFKEKRESFLKTSKNFEDLSNLLVYNDLERAELASFRVIKKCEAEILFFSKLYKKTNTQVFKELISITKDLLKVNKSINQICSDTLKSHTKKGALERGFMVISDLDDKNIKMKLNFRIEISKEEDEYRGEIEALDLVTYESTLDELISSIKEYIKDLKSDFSTINNDEMTQDLLVIKEILNLIILDK